MCGFFGAVFVDPARVDVEAALQAMAHRGPDDRRVYRHDDVVLGFDRLAVLDLTPAGAQPMVSPDGQIAVVFNGEIYNHHELRAELAARGAAFRSRSDTEVVVEGYRAWGEGVVARLDGMFALAIVDHARRRVVVARDRAGKKPLFWTRDGRGFRFASEIKGLVASGLVATPNREALPLLLTYGYVPAPKTLVSDVGQVEPATWGIFEAGGEPRFHRYWRPPFGHEPLRIDEEEAAEELRRLVEAAVKRRLEADVPIGAFLSGGLDSSVVVGTMAKVFGRKVKTFSIGFGDPSFDETEYARLVAETFETDHVEHRVEPHAVDSIERLVAIHDGPFGDATAVPQAIVSSLARREVTVALSGDGGDELFCGYTRFLAMEAEERTPLWLRRTARAVTAGAQAAGAGAWAARPARWAGRSVLPLHERILAWSGFFTFELDRIFRPEHLAHVNPSGPLAWSRGVLEEAQGSTLKRILHHNYHAYLPYDLLPKADYASMMHSLEVRSPLLDTALTEFAARLPDSLLRRGRTTKWLFRRAFRDRLPERVRRRGKMGFGMPLGRWFRGELRELLTDRLGSSALLYDYLCPTFVRGLVRDHLSGTVDVGQKLWLLLTLEIWLQSLQGSRVRAEAGASLTGPTSSPARTSGATNGVTLR